MGETSIQAPGAGKEGAGVDLQGGLTYQSIKGNEETLSPSSVFPWLRAREELEAERFPLETPRKQSHNALASLRFICSSMTEGSMAPGESGSPPLWMHHQMLPITVSASVVLACFFPAFLHLGLPHNTMVGGSLTFRPFGKLGRIRALPSFRMIYPFFLHPSLSSSFFLPATAWIYLCL